MIIDYLGHSGFLIETQERLLLFDYFKGSLDLLKNKPPEKPLFVFASHAHHDHFNPDIFLLREEERQTSYLLSFDIQGDQRIPQEAPVTFLDVGERRTFPGLGTVETLKSTDEGVAFLISTQDAVLFHAGDLHWWDWEGEDTAWLKEQEQLFKQEIGKLADRRVDVAFAVLDDRLEERFAKGMSFFLETSRPAYVFPMHFWADWTVVARYRELAERGEVAMPQGTNLMDTTQQTHWELQM